MQGGGEKNRRRSSSHRKSLSNQQDNPLGTDPTQAEATDSLHHGINDEVQNLKNQRPPSAEPGVTVGHEVETKKNNYVIVREIAKGRISRVFEVRRDKDQKVFAMKAHSAAEAGKAATLRHEAHVYHELSLLAKNLQKEDIRFFNIYDYGECSDGQFLFLTLGAESLAHILSEEKIPNYQSALDICFQMLNVIEQVHNLGFIHCRIRPNTFVTGLKPRERFTLFLVNFSLARMANPLTRPERTVSRTPPQIFDRYAPRCQHNGLPYHRRDDLESWFYISCDLFHPHFLPWSSDKRLKSAQMSEMKDKLMKGELYYRYAVMPKPFQAIAGAINETDGKIPNYNFFKECLMEEAKAKNCAFFAPWEFVPVASLPAVPEALSQTRIEFEFNQCLKNPTSFNFGNEKAKTVLPSETSKELSQQSSSDVQIVLPGKQQPQSPLKPAKAVAENKKKAAGSKRKNKQGAMVPMTASPLPLTPPAPDDETKISLKEPTVAPAKNTKTQTPPSVSSDEEDEEEETFQLKSPPASSETLKAFTPPVKKDTAKSSSQISAPTSKASSRTSTLSASSSSSYGSSVSLAPTTPSTAISATSISTAHSGYFSLPGTPSSSSAVASPVKKSPASGRGRAASPSPLKKETTPARKESQVLSPKVGAVGSPAIKTSGTPKSNASATAVTGGTTTSFGTETSALSSSSSGSSNSTPTASASSASSILSASSTSGATSISAQSSGSMSKPPEGPKRTVYQQSVYLNRF